MILISMNFLSRIFENMGAPPLRYQPISQKQDEDDTTPPEAGNPVLSQDRQTLRMKVIGLGFCFGILISTFLILFAISLILSGIIEHIPPISEPGQNSRLNTVASSSCGLQKSGTFTCGNSSDEARGLGCHWDIVSFLGH